MSNEEISKINSESKVCPFCGEKPHFDYGYMPPYMSLSCVNQNCNFRPYLEIGVKCSPSSDGKTCSPMFSEHIPQLLEKWNVRFLA